MLLLYFNILMHFKKCLIKVRSMRKINKKARKEKRPQDESKLNGPDTLKKSRGKSRNNLLVGKQLTHFCEIFIEFLKPEDVHVV